MLWQEIVLRSPRRELGVGVDEQHVASTLRRFRALGAQYEDTCRVSSQVPDRAERAKVHHSGPTIG
jgi:hypothetical protein